MMYQTKTRPGAAIAVGTTMSNLHHPAKKPDLTETRIKELEEGYREILRTHKETPQTQWIAELAHKLLPNEDYDNYGF